MSDILYVIADSARPSKTQYGFISTLTHEFKGMKEVLGYSDLDHALTWKDREAAEKQLSKLPDWAKGKHSVFSVSQSAFGLDYYVEPIRTYRNFILRPCNDGCSCDILWEDSWNLICIVGSMDDAIDWVDDWHRNKSSKK